MELLGDHGTGWFIALAVSLALTGVAGGLLAGLLGVGGGIVIVPVLYYVFELLGIDPAVRMHLAVGTSLATIIPTSIVSARAHRRRGALDLDLLRSLLPAIVTGVLLSAAAGGRLGSAVLTGVFGVVALAVSANMALRPPEATIADHLPEGWLRHLLGFAIGSISVLMGIGGGTLTVPLLTAFSYPIHRAVGTAAAIGLVISIPGTIGFLFGGLGAADRPPLSIGYVNVIGFALIVPMTTLCAPLGARIAHAINARMLRRAFALFLFVTGSRMLYRLFF